MIWNLSGLSCFRMVSLLETSASWNARPADSALWIVGLAQNTGHLENDFEKSQCSWCSQREKPFWR